MLNETGMGPIVMQVILDCLYHFFISNSCPVIVL